MALNRTLKLVAAQKPSKVDPKIARRQKLISAIRRQVQLIREAEKGGKSGGAWFWTDESGQMYLSVRYGSTVLELVKDKNAIQCKDLADVERILDVIEQAVIDGELDTHLTKASEDIRKHFNR